VTCLYFEGYTAYFISLKIQLTQLQHAAPAYGVKQGFATFF